MNTQVYPTLPIYSPFRGFSSNPESQRHKKTTVIPHSPLTMEQLGSVESLRTNKATNVRNDGSLARHTQKRISGHLDLLETRTLTERSDNILCSTNKTDIQPPFPAAATNNSKFMKDPAMESPLLRKIKTSKVQTPDQDIAAITKNHAPSQTTCPYKSCHKATKDKSVELYKTEWCRNWQELGVCR